MSTEDHIFWALLIAFDTFILGLIIGKTFLVGP